MPIDRFYTPEDLIPGQHVNLIDNEFHHLIHVTRAKERDQIDLINGKGFLAIATVHKIAKHQACLEIISVEFQECSPTEIILAQAIPRANRLDYILEKGTELGVSQIWLFPAEHGERKQFTEHQLERMNAILVSSTKQCGRLYLPKIVLKPLIEKWGAFTLPSFFGDLSKNAPLFAKVFEPSQSKQGAIFCIGPESGFTEKEEGKLRECGAAGVRLHPNILRTDTAAIMALSLLSHSLLA